MRKIIIALAFVLLIARPLVASDVVDVTATVNLFIDSFDKGDAKTAAGVCAEEISIIDDIAPHEWHGKDAFNKWMDAYDADAKMNGITDGFVSLTKFRHVDVSGDHAYVVTTATYKYKRKGKSEKDTGSTITFALHKTKSGWHITGLSYAKK